MFVMDSPEIKFTLQICIIVFRNLKTPFPLDLIRTMLYSDDIMVCMQQQESQTYAFF